MLLKRWREEEKAGARFTLESSEQHCVCGPLNFYLFIIFIQFNVRWTEI